MSEENKKVECSVHGTCSATFLCHHLLKGENLGFNVAYDPDSPNDLYPDAWCDLCNEILEKEGEWNDVSEEFSDIKLVCSGCYCEIREKNWIQDQDALHDLICSGFEYLQDAQREFKGKYRLDEHERWDWYQEIGKLIFSHDGKPVVECDIDFVGTFSSISNTWMWAWANSSFTENIKSASAQIKTIGEEKNLLKLASAIWPAEPVDGWEMTGIMAKEFGAIGSYRTPNDNGFAYMIVRQARWAN